MNLPSIDLLEEMGFAIVHTPFGIVMYDLYALYSGPNQLEWTEE